MSAPTDNNPYAVPAEGPHPDVVDPSTGARLGEPVPNRGRGLTVASFVLAVISLAILPIVVGPIGAVLGFVGYSKGDRLGRWAGITAIVCTVIGMIVGALVFKSMRS